MTDDTVILVCARVKGPLLIPDNKTGKCDVCGLKVEYRPHAPKKRILRCIECAFDLFEPDNDSVSTTSDMLADAMAYFRKKKQ